MKAILESGFDVMHLQGLVDLEGRIGHWAKGDDVLPKTSNQDIVPSMADKNTMIKVCERKGIKN